MRTIHINPATLAAIFIALVVAAGFLVMSPQRAHAKARAKQTSTMVSVALFTTAADESANEDKLCDALGWSKPQDNFNVPCSPTGTAPATHYATLYRCQPSEAQLIKDAETNAGATWTRYVFKSFAPNKGLLSDTNSGTETPVPQDGYTFDKALEDMGLIRIPGGGI